MSAVLDPRREERVCRDCGAECAAHEDRFEHAETGLCGVCAADARAERHVARALGLIRSEA